MVFVLLIPLQNIRVAIGFAIGGIFSASAGYIGMNMSVRANARVAESARGGISPALSAAFRGGSVTGLLVVGLALFGLSAYYGILTWIVGFSVANLAEVPALLLLHIAFGVLVLLLTLFRLGWWLWADKHPSAPPNQPGWQVRAAQLVHGLLYVLLLLTASLGTGSGPAHQTDHAGCHSTARTWPTAE